MSRLDSATYMEDLKSVCEEKIPYEKLAGCRILVTGATGLIGSAIVDTLMYMKRHKAVIFKLDILVRNTERAKEQFLPYVSDDAFRMIEGDLTRYFLLEQEYDYIIHGAGNNHPVAFAKEPVETMKTALTGTMSLLDSLVRQEKKGKFLLLSTGEVYGKNAEKGADGSLETDIGVVDPMAFRSCYPEAKRAAETLCVSYASEYGIKMNVARLSYIYGATFQESSTKADVQFLQKAISGEDIVMKSAGAQMRSYCYLADAVRGIMCILLNGTDGEVYNVANAESNVTIREFAETLAGIAGVKVIFENPGDAEQKGYSKLGKELLDPSKLKTLGYSSKVGLKDALKRILKIREES